MATDESQLHSHDLLIAEYNYIAQTAFQTNEDRARYVSFYVLSVGSLIAAIFSSQLDPAANPSIHWGFAVLFLAVGGMGLLTVWQLVRLRLAWFESICAMNQIKQFYINQAPPAGSIVSAFAWTNDKLPHRFKIQSISFMTAAQVAILAGINMGSSVMWIGFARGRWWWAFSFLIGITYAAALLLGYRYLLREPTEVANPAIPTVANPEQPSEE